MIIKFKNGYTVIVENTDGLSNREIRDRATAIVKALDGANSSYKRNLNRSKKINVKSSDAVGLSRRVSTGTAFQPLKLKAALSEDNTKAIELQLMYLDRDLAADLSEKNANYPSIYRREVLDKLIGQYIKAAEILRKANYLEKADEIKEKVEQLKELWGLIPEEIRDRHVKDVPPPLDDPTDYAGFESDYSVERLFKEVRYANEKYSDLPEVDRKAAMLQELDLVFTEIDELIAMGAEAITKAGWTKEDARRAIAQRYETGSTISPGIIKYLRRYGFKEEAKALAGKVRELKRAWHLTV